jgi:hypothetical protein
MFETNYTTCTWRSSEIYVAAVETLRNKERQDETQFIIKIGGKTSLGPSYFALSKFSFPVPCLMHYYVETGRSRPLIGRLYR